MKSGAGKDRICDYIDDHILKSFFIFFEDKARDCYLQEKDKIEKDALEKFKTPKDRKDYIKTKMKELRELDFEVNLGTPEGLFQDAKALKLYGFGSLFIKVSELGLFLDEKNQTNMNFLKTLYEAYNGKIISKSIKSEQREKTIVDMPTNALLHSDFGLIKTSKGDLYESLMSSGLARRAFVSFQATLKKSLESDAKQARNREEKAFERAKAINQKLFKLFSEIPDNAVYEITETAYDKVFHSYLLKMADLINNCEDDLLQKELTSRELKVLKLAGMFACLNHPTELIINEIDMNQAIEVTETLGQDFRKFLNYKPKQKDEYDRIFDFFLDNIDKSYSKCDLISNCRDFGFTRRKMQAEFDEAIIFVTEIAQNRSYCLIQEPINNNSGMKYCLKALNNKELSKNTKALTELI